MLTKACCGLIDAPRRWWKSLVQDTQQLGWRSCRHEPCLDDLARSRQTQGTHVFSRRRRHDQRSERRSRVQTCDGQGETSVRVGRMGTAKNLSSVVAEHDKQLTSPSQLNKRATSERSVSSRLVRQAHCETSDKLHCPVILDPVFVSFADASWANRKDFGSQCGYLCVGTVGWERRTLLSHLLAFSQVSQSCTFIRFC